LLKTAKSASSALQSHKVTVMATDLTLDAQSEDLMEDGLGTLHRKALTILKRIRDGALDPETGQKKGPSYSISKAASLVGRTASAIREAERDGRLPQRDRTASGHRVQYTLEELDQMRAMFGTRPWRSQTDTPAIISISNFKGGVGKSTIALHLAQHFAIHGYRVLFIDCDSQASSTMMFGYRPDIDLGEDDTLYGHFHNPELLGVRSIIRKTHFYGLDLIPANLKLYNLEYEIAGYLAQNQNFDIIDLIAEAIDSVVDDYDIVIMDPPPALGMVSMAVLQAANAMVIPMPPSVIDFASTVSFIDMARTTMKQLELIAGRVKPAYNFIRLVGSRVDESKSMHREILAMMRQVFGGSMTNSVLRTSAEIDNASSRMKTVFELDRPVTSHEVHTRCVKHLNDVCHEIEMDVLRTWESRAGQAD
jgi:chromosome partitioning protein